MRSIIILVLVPVLVVKEGEEGDSELSFLQAASVFCHEKQFATEIRQVIMQDLRDTLTHLVLVASGGRADAAAFFFRSLSVR